MDHPLGLPALGIDCRPPHSRGNDCENTAGESDDAAAIENMLSRRRGIPGRFRVSSSRSLSKAGHVSAAIRKKRHDAGHNETTTLGLPNASMDSLKSRLHVAAIAPLACTAMLVTRSLDICDKCCAGAGFPAYHDDRKSIFCQCFAIEPRIPQEPAR